MRRPEQALHIQVARYLDAALPADALFWHTPNGGARGKVEAAILKAMGVRAGFPDIAILYCGRLYLIELKAARGRCSAEQTLMMHKLAHRGARCAVCQSLDAVAEKLALWAIPVRGRIAA